MFLARPGGKGHRGGNGLRTIASLASTLIARNIQHSAQRGGSWATINWRTLYARVFGQNFAVIRIALRTDLLA